MTRILGIKIIRAVVIIKYNNTIDAQFVLFLKTHKTYSHPQTQDTSLSSFFQYRELSPGTKEKMLSQQHTNNLTLGFYSARQANGSYKCQRNQHLQLSLTACLTQHIFKRFSQGAFQCMPICRHLKCKQKLLSN